MLGLQLYEIMGDFISYVGLHFQNFLVLILTYGTVKQMDELKQIFVHCGWVLHLDTYKHKQ